MTPERWLKAKELFCQALECEPSRRNAFLEHACAGDQELLLEVKSLLSAVEDSQLLFHQPAVDLLGLNGLKLGEFLEADELAPASGPADRDLLLPETPKPKSALIGQQIGNYRLTQLIGRGGMGAVFLAVRADDDYEHEVAVKIVARPALTREVLRRFRTERQILARLDHPNIAKLFDGGTTPDGLPYFVMEYIEGEPITSYCDNRQLSIPERLRLFLKVCEAVQYAHQNLIIHRDIKPSNILVTAEGIPKLLDFGIAKVIAPRTAAVKTIETTKFGVLAFTPRYASPEQVRGQTVTTVSDVYSLGVLLYELLTGVPPYEFPQMMPAEIERVVCLVEPPRPGDVVRDRKKAKVEASVEVEAGQALPSAKTALERSAARGTTPEKLRLQLLGDLDTIVLTALRKEPERRYPLVAKLAEDLERHLTGLPVLARGDTVRYRFGKYVRRNKLALTVAILIAISLVSTTIISIWQVRTDRERIKAERQLSRVQFRTSTFLFGLHTKIEKLPGSIKTQKLVVEESLKYLNNQLKEATDFPHIQAYLAFEYLQIGTLQWKPNSISLGDAKGALNSYLKSVEILERLYPSLKNDVDLRLFLVMGYMRVGQVLSVKLGKSTEAEQYYLRAQKYLNELIQEDSTNSEYLSHFSALLNEIGVQFEQNGNTIDALESYRKSLSFLEKGIAKSPYDFQLKHPIVDTYQAIGLCLQNIDGFVEDKIGKCDASNYIMDKSFEANQRSIQALDNMYPVNVFIQSKKAAGFLAMAPYYVKQNQIEKAVQLNYQALEITREHFKNDPTNLKYRLVEIHQLIKLGETYSSTQRNNEAFKTFQQALSMINNLNAELLETSLVQQDKGIVLFNLGESFIQQKQINKSIQSLSEAAYVCEKLVRADPQDSAPGLLYSKIIKLLVEVLYTSKQVNKAELEMEKLLRHKQHMLQEQHAPVWELNDYASLLLTCYPPHFRNPKLAIECAERAVLITKGRNLTSLYTLASALYQVGDHQRADQYVERLVDLLPAPKSLLGKSLSDQIKARLKPNF